MTGGRDAMVKTPERDRGALLRRASRWRQRERRDSNPRPFESRKRFCSPPADTIVLLSSCSWGVFAALSLPNARRAAPQGAQVLVGESIRAAARAPRGSQAP